MSNALKGGIAGAVIGAIASGVISGLDHSLQASRGEISPQDATIKTLKDTAVGGVIGAASSFTVVAVSCACPPIGIALALISPVLMFKSGVAFLGKINEILNDHNESVKSKESSQEKSQNYPQTEKTPVETVTIGVEVEQNIINKKLLVSSFVPFRPKYKNRVFLSSRKGYPLLLRKCYRKTRSSSRIKVNNKILWSNLLLTGRHF